MPPLAPSPSGAYCIPGFRCAAGSPPRPVQPTPLGPTPPSSVHTWIPVRCRKPTSANAAHSSEVLNVTCTEDRPEDSAQGGGRKDGEKKVGWLGVRA